MKNIRLHTFLLLVMVTSGYVFAMSSKPHIYGDCSKDKKTLAKLYDESYHQLLVISATGEGGKMDTPQKEEAAKKYTFYAECLKKDTKIPSDSQNDIKPLLISCDSKIEKSDNILTIDMEINEKEAYGSLKRVILSVRNTKGGEFFRAMNNRSPVCAPIPPNAFGVYPVGEKENLELKDVISTDHEAQIFINTQYGNLVSGCKTFDNHGILNIKWKIRPVDWQCAEGKCSIYIKIVPVKSKDSQWQLCDTFVYSKNGLDAKTNRQQPKTNGTASVKPMLCFDVDDCHEADKITLIRFSRQKRKGTLKRWVGDTAYQYSYKELLRKVIDLKKLPDHRIILNPGFYQFEYNDVRGNPSYGFYGESDIIKISSGKRMEIPVWVESAI